MNPTQVVEPKTPPIDINSLWLPSQKSTLAPDIDWSWNVVMILSIILFLLLMGFTAYFVLKYRRRTDNDPTPDTHEPPWLEKTWTILPTIIVIGLFFVGVRGYVSAAVPPAESYEIQVTAQQWAWFFTYPNGVISNELVVPKGRPVKLIMSSKDVIHSVFVPELRVKNDVIPGQYTTLWFEATALGESTIECTEYCGTGHSRMLSPIRIVEEPEFKVWLDNKENEDKSLPPDELGKKLFAEKQCITCHSVDGSKMTGPTLKGVFGHEVTLADGSKVIADENYIRESIMNSQAKLVQGYPGVMPLFEGLLKDRQVDGLVAYIKTLK